MPYLQEPPPLGGGILREFDLLGELRLKISLFGVLPLLDDHLRPLSLLFRLFWGWRLVLGAPLPQGPLGQPGVHGLLESPLAHLFVFLNINYYS